MGEDGEGRVGRFRRRFEGVDLVESGQTQGQGQGQGEVGEEGGGLGVGKREVAFGEGDLEWMGEGARAESAAKVPEKKGAGASKGVKKK